MVCRVCNGRFEPGELAPVKDRYPYGEGYCEQVTAAACPNCGATDLAACACCEECGGEFDEAQLHDGLCVCCREELTGTLDWAWALLSPVQKRWAAANTAWMDA